MRDLRTDQRNLAEHLDWIASLGLNTATIREQLTLALGDLPEVMAERYATVIADAAFDRNHRWGRRSDHNWRLETEIENALAAREEALRLRYAQPEVVAA